MPVFKPWHKTCKIVKVTATIEVFNKEKDACLLFSILFDRPTQMLALFPNAYCNA